jgi:prepilin-type N-terminal cleavage/methylation domain-containing protein
MFEQRIGKQLARRARQVCASTSGLSLVEVLVASAIIAIVSILLVVAFYTMGSVSMRAADITNADEQLSSDIAFDEGTKETSTDKTLEFVDQDNNPIKDKNGNPIEIEIPLNSNKYETDDGRNLWTFGYLNDTDTDE